MNPIGEPPDPRQARILLTKYLQQVSEGVQVNGELQAYGSKVISDFKDKIPYLQSHGNYARALDVLANSCYRGAGDAKELEKMLEELSKELSSVPSVERAKALKESLEVMNQILS